MKKLKFCHNCKRIYHKEITLKQRLLKIPKYVLIVFLLITSTLGSLALYNFFSGRVYDNPDIMLSIGGFYSTVTFIQSYFQEGKNELEEIAINLTKDCSTDYEKAKIIYEHLLTFEYELGENLNAYEVYQEGKFDCDEGSNILVIMLKKISIDSIMQCELRHCYVIIKLEDMNIKADITKQIWEEHQK